MNVPAVLEVHADLYYGILFDVLLEKVWPMYL